MIIIIIIMITKIMMMESTDAKETFKQLRKAGLETQAEPLVSGKRTSPQKAVTHHIDKSAQSPFCMMSNEKGKTVHYVISEYKKLGHKEYK